MKKIEKSLKEKVRASLLKDAWENTGLYHHHGINIPLFSIHSKDSCGIGEFLDLKLLIDFVSSVNMDIIQLLPLNDTGYETSPYNAVSSLALNPIYLSLKKLPFIKSNKEMQMDIASFKKYSYLQKVAYNAVLNAKLSFLKKYYKAYFNNFESSPAYRQFLKDNQWLNDYGLFKCLKDDYAHKGWFSWEDKHKNITSSFKRKLIQQKEREISFYIFLQFLCFSQMEQVKAYAEKKKILLKGDIPILISPESLDVWQGRKNFNLNYSAGAPPDQFSKVVQNWGFPIYDWKYMEKTNYLFWKDRLQVANKFYHLYRIDHIIGLYRIYAIKRGTKGKGIFIPKNLSDTISSGEKILKKLTSFTSMLPIGEDLGADINPIRKSLTKHVIPGTKVLRWEKNYKTDGSFIPFDKYNPLSLTCVSTHDSQTLTLWWQNNPKEAKAFAKANQIEYKKHLSHKARHQILKASHQTASLFHINLLPETLALFEDLVWDDPKDEQINIPGTILPSNWCYKMRPCLEHILEHEDLKSIMKDFSF